MYLIPSAHELRVVLLNKKGFRLGEKEYQGIVESLINTADPVTIEIETKTPMKRKMLIAKVSDGMRLWYGSYSKKAVRIAIRGLKTTLKPMLPFRLAAGVKLRFDIVDGFVEVMVDGKSSNTIIEDKTLATQLIAMVAGPNPISEPLKQSATLYMHSVVREELELLETELDEEREAAAQQAAGSTP